eukprot:PhM_4_TR4988/c0_g1_i1/m.30082
MVKINVLKAAMPTKIFERFLLTRKRLKVNTALTYCPEDAVMPLMRRALTTGHLHRNSLQQTFLLLRRLEDYPRARVVARLWEEEFQRRLSPVHINTLMSFAVKADRWQDALGWWSTLTSNPDSEVTAAHYNTLLSALRSCGRWQQAIGVVRDMQEEQIEISSHTMHVITSMLRQQTGWHHALSIIQNVPMCVGYVRHSEKTSAVTTELLLLLHTAAGASRQYRKIAEHADALVKECLEQPVPLGVSNAYVSVLSQCRRWEAALKHISQIERVSTHTLNAVVPCCANHVERLAPVLKFALETSVMPPTSLYLQLFRSLVDSETPLSAAALYTQLRADAVNDLSNIALSMKELNAGFIDGMLMAKRNAAAAYTMTCKAAESLAPAVLLMSDGYATIGSEFTRQIKHGRVAVVDGWTMHSVATKLLPHVDHVVVPFSVLRGQIVQWKEAAAPTSHKKAMLERRFETTKKALNSSEELREFVTFLPLLSQLYAHKMFEREVNIRKLDDEERESEKRNRLLDDGEKLRKLTATDAQNHHEGMNVTALVEQPASAPSPLVSSFSSYPPSVRAKVSVAFMLQRLNPEAEVHFVTMEPDTRALCEAAGVPSIPAATVDDVKRFFEYNPGKFPFRLRDGGEKKKKSVGQSVNTEAHRRKAKMSLM